MTPIKLINDTWPPQNGAFRSSIVLYYDNWNDYGYRTSFVMCYCDADGMVREVGNVKIYYWQNDEVRTNQYGQHTKNSLCDHIESLSASYCSLGQELLYYKNLKELLPNEYLSILTRLNDIAVFDKIKDRFINENGVQASLLRFSGAEKAFNEAKGIIFDGLQTAKDMSFKYQIVAPYDTSPALLYFDFTQTDILPYRINILIGKNGTGKTQTLSRLANSLSGYTDTLETGTFVDRRPPVDKVMSISYSAFDCFRKPPEGTDGRSFFSYVYCGIQSEQGTLSLPQLKENLKRAFLTIKDRGRQEIWKRVLSELMEAEHQRTVELISTEQFDDVNLSSGQQILICTVTELIANIENESIVLFDEPEIHLHPNAIANMVRMFYRLLEEFNSYAIFSTHSPLVLQEIPSRYIQILDRVDNSLNVRKPDIECFGNNISEIVLDAFDVTSGESNFKSHLYKLSRSKSYDEIVGLFDGKLSLNALIFLKNCYMEEG
jgi:hypothetical protein